MPGSRFRAEIAQELSKAKCVVVLWSRHSIESDWVIDEAEDAKRRNVLVQALLENLEPPHGFRQIQSGSLLSWKGGHNDPVLLPLLSGISRFTSDVRSTPQHNAESGSAPDVHGGSPENPATPGVGLKTRILLTCFGAFFGFWVAMLIVGKMSTADWQSLGISIPEDTYDDQGRLIGMGTEVVIGRFVLIVVGIGTILSWFASLPLAKWFAQRGAKLALGQRSEPTTGRTGRPEL